MEWLEAGAAAGAGGSAGGGGGAEPDGEAPRETKVHGITVLPGTARQHMNLRFASFRTQGQLDDELFELTWLSALCIDEAYRVRTISPKIGRLASLRDLLMAQCEVTALPAELGNLAILEKLSLSHFQHLESVPPEIGRLSNLSVLSLFGAKQLTHLPAEIGELRALKRLSLSQCVRLEALPPELGRLGALDTLELAECGRLASAGFVR